MRLVCSLVLLLGGLQLACALPPPPPPPPAPPLRVAAWNIQNFGPSKANLPGVPRSPQTLKKATILNYIAKIVRRYDIIVIQEVREPEAHLPVINALLDAVNNQAGPQYKFINSRQLGPNTNVGLGPDRHMERYVYLFNKDTVRVFSSHHYPNQRATYNQPYPPTFIRPPYVARFQNTAGGKAFDYTFIPLHAIPDATTARGTVQELNFLVDVVDHVKLNVWTNVKNILLLGDFNAGCDYVRKNTRTDEFTNIRLWTWTNIFHVLIGHNVATNVGASCPYDRIVADSDMNRHVVPGTAKVFNFQREPLTSPLRLPNGVNAIEVSDHFPVEVQLQP